VSVSCNYVDPETGRACACSIGLDATGRCFTHSEQPARVKKRKDARRRGGHATNRARTVMPDDHPPAPTTLEGLAEWHRWTATAVATGKIDARTAGEITRSLKELRPTLEQIDLGNQLRELRRQLTEAKRERAGG
jgi:hypothetical protein